MRTACAAGRFVAALASTLLAVAAQAGPVEGGPSPKRLTIERLYSLPDLIGTAPGTFTWSPDGSRLAFLWNDEGRNRRDVWVLDTADTEPAPRRLTAFEPRVRVPTASNAFDRLPHLEQTDRRDRDPGVTEIVWTPDGRGLLARYGGWHRISGESTPVPVALVPAPKTAVGRAQPPAGAPRPAEAPTPTQATFSGDGSTLAFLHGGDLWTRPADLDPDAAPVRRSAAEEPGVSIARYRWAPTGRVLALLERDAGQVPERAIPDYLTDEPTLHKLRRAYPGEPAPRHRIGIVDLDGDDASILWLDLDTDGEPPGQILDFHWSHDGRYLAVDTSDLYAKDRRVFVADRGQGSRAAVVWRDADPHNETFYFWRIAWSKPEPKRDAAPHLYLLSDRAEDYHAYRVAPDGSDPARLTTPAPGEAWAVAALHPVPGGLVVVANAPKVAERQLFRVDDDGTTPPVRLSQRAGTHQPVVAPDGRYAAVHFSSDDAPPDLFLTRLDHTAENGRENLAREHLAREHRVTRSPLPAFDDYRWVTPRYVTFASHVDGVTLHGRLTLPPDFDPARTYPAILGSVYTDSVRNQWGGRTAHPTWGLDQYLAQEGYVLLNVDMRGSWGKGRDFRRGIRLDYGGMDIEDLESGVRYLGTLGYVDMDRVGIWGSSYGGLMTTMSLFKKPGLYAAGIAGAPATNVRHALTGQMAVMMEPADQAAAYSDSSPYLHAYGLEDPLMIVHGMRDWVVLYRDSVNLVHRLILEGKDVELVTLPDAGHGWDNEGRAQTRFAFRQMVRFFDTHLRPSRGDATPSGDTP